MGLDILSDNSKNNDQKIDLLKNLMSIQSAGDTGYKRIDNLISDFTEIDAKAPEGAIATDTPWPKALRIFAQKILSDVSADITDQNRILALEAYLNKLKSGDSDVSSIQTKIQSGSILTCNSTQKSAEDFLKRISNVPAGEDGKKDISSIKAFDDAAAASIDIASAADAAAAVAAAAAAEAKKAKIRADFSTEDTAETFYQTLYKYRLGVARDILKSVDDNEKIGKLKTLFLYNVKPTTLEDRRDDFVNWFADSDFLAPDITDIKTPLSAGNLRTFANAILDDKDVAPDVKIRALNSHIQELLGLTAESANNDAFNFYKTEAIPANSSSVLSNLKAIATKFLNDFKSGSTPTFESAYNTVFIPAPAPAAAAAAAPTATPALARRAAPAADTAAHAP